VAVWAVGPATEIRTGVALWGRALDILVVTSNVVRLGFLQALLADAGIESVVLDQHISAVEGGIGAFPRRLAVRGEDLVRARGILREAGEDH
jgi:hypothetical protein